MPDYNFSTVKLDPMHDTQNTTEFKPYPKSTMALNPDMAEPTTVSESTRKAAELGSDVARYAAPAAVGIATGGMSLPAQAAIGGATAFAGEVTADQLDRLANDETFGNLYESMKKGSVAGAVDAAFTVGMHGLGEGMKWGIGKMFRRGIGSESLKAQEVLGRVSKSEYGKLSSKAQSKYAPLSLTPGQLTNSERGLLYNIESVARSGLFSNKLHKYDLNQIDRVSDTIKDYMVDRSAKSTPAEFGVFLKEMLGEGDDVRSIFNPVETFRSALYKEVDTVLDSTVGDTAIDLRNVHKFLVKNVGNPTFKSLRGLGESLDIFPKLNESDKWAKMPARKVYGAIKDVINSSISSAPDNATVKQLNKVRSLIEEQFGPFKLKNKSFGDALNTANNFNAAKQEIMYNDSLDGIRRAIAKNPGGAVTMLSPTSGNVTKKYEMLKKVRDGVFMAGIASGKTAKYADMYEKNVLGPIRFMTLTSAVDETGALNPIKLKNMFQKLMKDSPEFATELYGKNAKHIEDLASTLSVLGETPGKSMILQMQTAGALGGLATYAFSDNPKVQKVGALGSAAILLSPAVLSRALTNPSLTRQLTDGLREYSKIGRVGPALSISLRKLAGQGVVQNLTRDAEPELTNFYHFNQGNTDEQ